MKTLYESIFDKDLDSKKVNINGVEVDPYIWNKCKEYFDSISLKKVESDIQKDQDRWNGTAETLYLDKDCGVFYMGNPKQNDMWLYVICTETVYMNYLAVKNLYPDMIDIDDLKRYVDASAVRIKGLTFAFSAKVNKYGMISTDKLQWGVFKDYPSSPSPSRCGLGSKKITHGYIPETISNKAKKTIESLYNL